MTGRPTTSGLVLLFAIVTLLAPPQAEAKRSRVERSFRGKVVILKKRPPMRFKSQGAWISFLRRNRMSHVWPDKKAVRDINIPR